MSQSTQRLRAPVFTFGSALRESTGFLELPRLALSYRDLLEAPAGDGSPVVVFPGFGADDRSTWPLRRFLAGLGYRPRRWGRGANVHDVTDD